MANDTRGGVPATVSLGVTKENLKRIQKGISFSFFAILKEGNKIKYKPYIQIASRGRLFSLHNLKIGYNY